MSDNFEVRFDDDQKVPIKSWTRGVLFEEEAQRQLKNIASLPFVHSHVAAMPDVHYGIGATVGSVIATKGAIIPAAVGVDIGCGMVACRLPLTASDLPDTLNRMRGNIERNVPHGFAAFKERTEGAAREWERGLGEELDYIAARAPGLNIKNDPALQLGTLGGGNHFVEVCLDENQDVWVMLHSGSRGIGNMIGRHYIEVAREEMRRWFVNLPDVDLAYLPEGSAHFHDYINAVDWAQRYAMRNRELMLRATLDAIAHELKREPFDVEESAVNCHHNYVNLENHFGSNVWLTRKGAVSAREGELGIIPGSMGTRSYIVRGKGNPQSFHSCSHGAGRAMSRAEARRRFTTFDHRMATEGVECRKDESVIDETPGAYKNIDHVMAAQSDLVEVVHTLKQVLCVKG